MIFGILATIAATVIIGGAIAVLIAVTVFEWIADEIDNELHEQFGSRNKVRITI